MANEHRDAVMVYNTDIHSMVRRYNRFIVEIQKSQSSGLSWTMPFDIARVRAYVTHIRAYLNHVVAQPLLDCPETGPTEIPLPPAANPDMIENESAFDVIQLMEIARDEIAHSQSARSPTNVSRHDYERQIAYLQKMDNLLDYIDAQEPMDYPESSPMQPMTGPGRTGV